MKYLKVFETGVSMVDKSYIKFELEKIKDNYKPLIPYCSITDKFNRNNIGLWLDVDNTKYGNLYTIKLQSDYGYNFLDMNDKIKTEKFMLDIQNKLDSIIENNTILVEFQLANVYVKKYKIPNSRKMLDISDKYKEYIKKVSSNLDDLKDDDLASSIERLKSMDGIQVDFKIKYGCFVYLTIKLDNKDMKKDIIDELEYTLNIYKYEIREREDKLFIDIIIDYQYLNINKNDLYEDEHIDWTNMYKLIFLAPNSSKLESFIDFKL